MTNEEPSSSRRLLSQMDELVARLRGHIDELKDELLIGDPSVRTPAMDNLLQLHTITEPKD